MIMRLLRAMAVCVLVLAASSARAEVAYHDLPLSAGSLVSMCKFNPDTTPNLEQNGLPAECEGFMRAIITLFHTGEITDLLPVSECIDLSGEIPAWRAAIINSANRHAKEADALESAVTYVIQSVTHDYPCSLGDHPDLSPGHGHRAAN